MKFVLAAIGSKYIHCNLAVHSLKAYAEAGGVTGTVETAEYTINQNAQDILADLYRRDPDAVGFSCYIWNISMVKRLAADLHKLKPEADIWLGGPEVSYDTEECFRQLPFLRGVMVGEGEETFLRIMRYYDGGKTDLSRIPGIVWQPKAAEQNHEDQQEGSGRICHNPPAAVMNLSSLPFVYEHMEGNTDHKILYYESSRGCPFSCSYCLSSIDKKLRFRDPELVEKELSFFLEKRVPQVKFVDRTFNCSHSHARRIWRYLAEHDNGVTNFHFEISADLLDEEELELLNGLRPGLVQLEIGVQSVNPETLKAIRRTVNLDRLARNVRRIAEAGNIHEHLDLIAGLPYEDYDSFRRSFDWVYALRPEQLQLGFLKVLKGSYMQEMAGEYGLVYGSEPPYEVLKTRWISYEELCRLKQVEKVLEIYYNSGQFSHTMERLASFYESPFAMYERLADYFEEHGLFDRQISRPERFTVLRRFIEERGGSPGKTEIPGFYGVAWRELLVYDYYLRENAKVRPDFAPDAAVWRQSVTDWYARYGADCPKLAAYRDNSYRQLLHMTHAEVFSQDFSQNGQKRLVIFDYKSRDPLTGNAVTWEAEEWTKDNG